MPEGKGAGAVRYRAQPAIAHVLVPRASATTALEAKPQNFIDQHVLNKLRRLNLPPAEVCDDATFLRRAYLDVAGQLPTPDEVRAFLADPSPQKRDAKIEELLAEKEVSAAE